jgi:hypothetical protein
MDMALTVARRKLGVGEDWRPSMWECLVGNDLLMEGAVVPDVAKGPRQGMPDWKKAPKAKRQRVVVTASEVAAETKRWETETGKCSECMGTKEVFASWSRTHGCKNKPCRACKATGVAGLNKPGTFNVEVDGVKVYHGLTLTLKGDPDV